MERIAMAGMLDLKKIFKLVKDGFNQEALGQQELIG